MSATNSRIAHLRRIAREMDAYAERKNDWTTAEHVAFTRAHERLGALIQQEMLRTVDYLKAS